MNAAYQYLFGPVPSRRFGRSLGVDVTPLKTCSLNCVFCQIGVTPAATAERAEYVPFAAVCGEMERWLKTGARADVITFAGSGEPTLYSRLGELIDFIKARARLPVVLLSNGALFYRPDVRADAAKADIVKVSLSAWDEASYRTINRPPPDLTFEQLVAGERAFRAEYGGAYWLEVFLMEGINADPAQVRGIAKLAAEIRPDKIHLNTAVRPPAEPSVRPVTPEKLSELCGIFTPRAEIIASFSAAKPARFGEAGSALLMEMIRRHPSTAEQLAAITGVRPEKIEADLAPLVKAGALLTEEHDGSIYYK